MLCSRLLVAALLSLASAAVLAQSATQVELKIEPNNRTLTVSAEDDVTVQPDLAILHVGFETGLTDAKSAYADGARTSNAIIDAIKQAGIPESDIHSEYQRLDRDYQKPHKFKLVQGWTVHTPPARAAEILDAAVGAGASDSGDIEWTMRDLKALESKAIEQAGGRARQDAEALAKTMGAKLGALIYVSNQVTSPSGPRPIRFAARAMAAPAAPAPPLAIEPQQVSRSASVYAVYAIE